MHREGIPGLLPAGQQEPWYLARAPPGAVLMHPAPGASPAQPGLQATPASAAESHAHWPFGPCRSISASLAQEILNHDAPAAVEVLMDAAEAADDTPFRERVLAHGAVFSNPTGSG